MGWCGFDRYQLGVVDGFRSWALGSIHLRASTTEGERRKVVVLGEHSGNWGAVWW